MLSGVKIDQDKIIDENALPIEFGTQYLFVKRSNHEPYFMNEEFIESKFTKFINENRLSDDEFGRLFNQLKTVMNNNTEKLKYNVINKSGEDFMNNLK